MLWFRSNEPASGHWLVETGLLMLLAPGAAGALTWLRLVELLELVFAGALGGFAGAGASFSGGFWQPARTIAITAKTVRNGILFFMGC